MENLLGTFKELWANQEYDKITEISMLIFILLTPSFSFIFLYKREMFFELDLIKLLILCTIINCMVAVVIYTFDYIFNNYKLLQEKDAWINLKIQSNYKIQAIDALDSESEKYRRLLN